MLRATPGPAPFPAALRRVEPVVVPPGPVRPRVAAPSPVITVPAPRAVAVRGHVSNGSAAALILDSKSLCVVFADRSRRRRVRRFAIHEVLAVEERRHAGCSELVILTAGSTIYVADVDVAQAWVFTRELRQLILDSGL